MRTALVPPRAAVGLLMLVLGACAVTAPTRFYVLESPPKPRSQDQDRGCVVLGVGPVEIPAYLDRPQIVIRVSPNEIQPSDFEQWGEPLAQGIARVMGEAIAGEVCVKRVEYFPWKSFAGVDYQVTLRVNRFEAIPGQKVELLAHWSLYGQDLRKPLAEGDLEITEPLSSKTYEEMVALQSRVLQKGAGSVAEAITKLRK